MFQTFSNRLGSRCCCPGSKIQDTYRDSFDDNGVRVVVKSGEIDTDEIIQSYKDDVDIYTILDRLSVVGGEVPAVDPNLFADISSAPDNIHDAMAIIRSARERFDSLPVDIRKVYNNNPEEFLADVGSERFMSFFAKKDDSISFSDVDLVRDQMSVDDVLKDSTSTSKKGGSK